MRWPTNLDEGQDLAARLWGMTEAELSQVDSEIDRLAARLWGLTEEDLAEVQWSLVEGG